MTESEHKDELERSLEDARRKAHKDFGRAMRAIDPDGSGLMPSPLEIAASKPLADFEDAIEAAVRADERAPWADIARKQALTINYLQTVSKDVPDALKAMLARAETAEAALADERARVLGPAADQLRKALVEAAIPLEVLLADKRERGPIEKIASSTYEAIEQGVNAIRSALAASPVPGPAEEAQ